MKKVLAVAVILFLPFVAIAATTPGIVDTLPVTLHALSSVSSDSFTYTVPSAPDGNTAFVCLFDINSGTAVPTATLNGATVTFTKLGNETNTAVFYGVLVAPTTGTFSISWGSALSPEYSCFTTQDTNQTTPVDASGVNTSAVNATSLSVSFITTVGNDLLVEQANPSSNTFSSHGAGQTEVVNGSGANGLRQGSYVAASSTPGTNKMSENWVTLKTADIYGVALKFQAAATPLPVSDNSSWFLLL